MFLPSSRKNRLLHPLDLQIKLVIPRSWFTKKGPGVEARARKRVRKYLSEPMRRRAVEKGWIPEAWL